MKKTIIQFNKHVTFQTIESFGMSTAWWGKMVGKLPEAEEIMKKFYDPVDGIGLTNIRYNIGAGSKGKGYVIDQTRCSESFEVSKGHYDFSIDNYTMKLVDLSLKYGCKEIVFFSISPLERMTRSKMVCGSIDPLNPSNHLEEYYEEYADYILDVVAYFIDQGYPVKYVSPINEPQWEWGVLSQSQEGCYYTKEEVRELYSVFVKRITERNINVSLAGHDGGEWMTAIDYAKEMFKDESINAHMNHLDSHSYWTSKKAKIKAKEELDANFPNKKLVMSEWCEMKGGLDYGMDAALVLANTIQEDLSILNVVSWQYWTGIEQEKYNHKVALMYLKDEKEAIPTKKFYAFGNFTKYIRPGFTRIETKYSNNNLLISTYISDKKIVSVIINNGDNDELFELNNYEVIETILTDDTHDLEVVSLQNVIPKRSIITLILKEV